MGRHHVVRRRSKVAARTRQNINCTLCTAIVVGTFAVLPLFAVPVPATEWAHIEQATAPVPMLTAAPPHPASELPLQHIRELHRAAHSQQESLVADTQPLFRISDIPIMHGVVPSVNHRLRWSHPDTTDRHTNRGSHVDHPDFGQQNSDHDSSPERIPHDRSDDHHSAGSPRDGSHEHGDSHDGHGGVHGDSHGHDGSHGGGHGGGSHGSHGGGHEGHGH